MQLFINCILIIEFSLILKYQVDLLSFSCKKSENMNCNVYKTVIDEHFDLLAHENGSWLKSCIYQNIEQATLNKTY